MNVESKLNWPFLRQKLPTILLVIGVVMVMNADDSQDVSGMIVGGALIGSGMIWSLIRQRQVPKTLDEPIFELGQTVAVGPHRMKVWQAVGGIAFFLLGCVIFLGMEEAQMPFRIGLSLCTFAIVGAFLTLLSEKLRRFGGIVLGAGILLSGIAFLWGAAELFAAGGEGSAIKVIKCSLFGVFMSLGGLSILLAATIGGGRTPIYATGFSGPYGFVAWESAERLEMVGDADQAKLLVGAYKGWTLWVDIPADARAEAESFFSDKLKFGTSAA